VGWGQNVGCGRVRVGGGGVTVRHLPGVFIVSLLARIAGTLLLPVLWRLFRTVNELQQMRNLTFNTTVVRGDLTLVSGGGGNGV
jgi:hypothetical protein